MYSSLRPETGFPPVTCHSGIPGRQCNVRLNDPFIPLSRRIGLKHLVTVGLLLWYVGFFLFMGIAPFDPQSWAFANILPLLFVGILTISYRYLPFSCASYVLFAVFLTLHTVGSHYTYAQVPFGLWLEELFDLPRNHFDRIVHFCFGLFFAHPLLELFKRVPGMSTWIRAGLVVVTLVGLGGLWEILESWVTRIVHPELGLAYLGAQGDIWDAQKDMAATLYGALSWLLIMIISRKMTGSRVGWPRESSLELPHASDHGSYRH
jgi:putative membrane protein